MSFDVILLNQNIKTKKCYMEKDKLSSKYKN